MNHKHVRRVKLHAYRLESSKLLYFVTCDELGLLCFVGYFPGFLQSRIHIIIIFISLDYVLVCFIMSVKITGL